MIVDNLGGKSKLCTSWLSLVILLDMKIRSSYKTGWLRRNAIIAVCMHSWRYQGLFLISKQFSRQAPQLRLILWYLFITSLDRVNGSHIAPPHAPTGQFMHTNMGWTYGSHKKRPISQLLFNLYSINHADTSCRWQAPTIAWLWSPWGADTINLSFNSTLSTFWLIYKGGCSSEQS